MAKGGTRTRVLSRFAGLGPEACLYFYGRSEVAAVRALARAGRLRLDSAPHPGGAPKTPSIGARIILTPEKEAPDPRGRHSGPELPA